MSILLEIAKALSRIDNKVDLLYSELGPLANQIGKDAQTVRLDKALLHELERECNHPHRSMLAETGVKVAERRSRELLAAGDTHPNVLSMKEANDTLQEVGGMEAIESARGAFLRHKEKGRVSLGAAKVFGANAAEKMSDVEQMMQRALRYGQNIEDLRIELEVGLSEQVSKLVRHKFDDLRGEEMAKARSLADRVRQIEKGVLQQQEKLEAHQEAIRARITQTEVDFSHHEKRLQSLIHKTHDALSKEYVALDRRFDSLMQGRREKDTKILEALKGKQQDFVKNTFTLVQEESAKIKEAVAASLRELERTHKELKSLEDQTKKSILEVQNTVARVGNSLPKVRSRIRNG